MRKAAARFEFKPQDCWIGVFWKRTNGPGWSCLNVWICILPMFPLHLWFGRHE